MFAHVFPRYLFAPLPYRNTVIFSFHMSCLVGCYGLFLCVTCYPFATCDASTFCPFFTVFRDVWNIPPVSFAALRSAVLTLHFLSAREEAFGVELGRCRA